MYLGDKEKRKKIKQKIVSGCIGGLVGMAVLCTLFSAFPFEKKGKENGLREKAAVWIQGQMNRTYLPVFAFMEEETGIHGNLPDLLEGLILGQAPLYRYSEEQAGLQISIEDEDTYDLLIREEGTDEDRKGVEDGSLEYGEDALHIDGDLERAMREENNSYNENIKEEEVPEEEEEPEEEKEFRKALDKSYTYDWSGLREYDDIVSAFYAIDSTTSITDEQLNLENLLGKDMALKGGAEAPQILIYHTHSQEGFVDSVAGDASTTIVGAGDRLAQILTEEYGFNVLHHKGEYDVEARDYAYSNSLPAIERILVENPSIEVVIDLHRDAVAEGKKLAVNLQGRPTAQFMFFNGLSRTRKNGDISYLENPYVDDNLAFSFQAQIACNEYYPGLARRIYLKGYRYNMHLRARCMLIELGAQTNTIEEIMNACDPLAHVLAKVLYGETGTQAREAAGVELEE